MDTTPEQRGGTGSTPFPGVCAVTPVWLGYWSYFWSWARPLEVFHWVFIDANYHSLYVQEKKGFPFPLHILFVLK